MNILFTRAEWFKIGMHEGWRRKARLLGLERTSLVRVFLTTRVSDYLHNFLCSVFCNAFEHTFHCSSGSVALESVQDANAGVIYRFNVSEMPECRYLAGLSCTIEWVCKLFLLLVSKGASVQSFHVNRVQFKCFVAVSDHIILLVKVSETCCTVSIKDGIRLETDGLCVELHGVLVFFASKQAVALCLQRLSCFGTFLEYLS